MPRTTNADRILSEARERLNAARLDVDIAADKLNLANAAMKAHLEAYNALEKALTPKPRKKAEPKASAPKQAEPKAQKDPKCGICYEVADHENHDTRYLSSHPFDAPKSAQRAGRRSSRKGAAEKSTASSEIEKETALGVGAGD